MSAHSEHKTGVLLINLGTPDEPTPEFVKPYLEQFLMDPDVITLPWLLRWPLVHWLISPRRSKASAKLYQKIWLQQGSPLLHYTESLAQKLQQRLGHHFLVVPAMRYGKPSIESAFLKLDRWSAEEILVCPLYPQFSQAAWESSVKEFTRIYRKYRGEISVRTLKPFYDNPYYIDASAQVLAPHIQGDDYDLLLFSYHGLPEQHIRSKDPTSKHCLRHAQCCEGTPPASRAIQETCYRFQCFETTRQIVKRLGLPKDKFRVAFQSRLAWQRWIQPFSDVLYEKLPSQGIKRLKVVCPGFVADCLETLEEVQIRGEAQFQKKGGTRLQLIPCLNDSDPWVEGLAKMVQEWDYFSQGTSLQTEKPLSI